MNTHMHGGETAAGGTRGGGGRQRSLWKSPAFITALILLIPVLGNLFGGWHWELRGFVLVGTLLFGTGLAFQLVTRNVDAIAYRAAVAVAFVAAFLLVWVNFIQAADDVNPDAVMYFVVPLVGLIGVAMARLRPAGMACALFATALVHALVLAIALMVRNPQLTPWTAAVLRGFGLNALFVILFVGSALLFRKAARGESTPDAA